MKYKYNSFNNHKFESHMTVLSEVLNDSKILEIGCATGYFSEQLKMKNCRVWGVDIDKNSVKKAKKFLEKALVGDAANVSKYGLRKNFFDYILLQDVLEHIIYPEIVMKRIKPYLNANGKVIISTPNIGHISIIINLLTGNFIYNDKGIMDKTHVHFFTEKSLRKMLNEEGYFIENINYSADFGMLPFVGRYLRYIPKIIQYQITKLFNSLLAGQFIVTCRLIN